MLLGFWSSPTRTGLATEAINLASPSDKGNCKGPTPAMLKSLRVGDDEDLERAGVTEEEKERERREQDARAQALTLEMVGDLPFADVKVPEASLFVCKLNSVTTSEDVRPCSSRRVTHTARDHLLAVWQDPFVRGHQRQEVRR